MTSEDETIIFRRPPPVPAPGAQVVAPEPPPAREIVPPLRDAVLDGLFFGASHQDAAARLAAFLVTAKNPLEIWFGTEAAEAHDAATLAALLDRDIVALDALLSSQLDAILHHPRLLQLEGRWRGLFWLASRLALAGRVKMKMLNASWAEICRDLERAAEFDSSNLFKAIYENEFGMAGGEPYGLLLVDHELRHRPGPGAPTDDVSALASLASVAAAAFAPLVLGASPALLGVDHFAELSGVAEPAGGFVSADYARWRGLSNRDDMRFIAVALPRVLARPLWQEALGRHRGFRYAERAARPDARVWFSAIYTVAACVARAFEAYSWPADMRGYDIDRIGGGVVETLLEPVFSIDPADGLDRTAMELTLTDHQERSLVAAGLLPVGVLPYGGQALLGATRSLQAPAPAPKFLGAGAAAAAANLKLSAQFNTMLCVSRFAHYVKIIGRDMVGAFRTAEEIQAQLQRWILRFVNASTDAGADIMSRYPLRDAAVAIHEIPGKPGVFGCVVQLQPHFQLDDVAASFRLMTELAVPKPR